MANPTQSQSNGAPREALTFDDVLLQPGLSDVLPSDVDVRSRITRDIFMRVVSEFPDFGTKVMSALSRKLTGSVTEFDRIRHMLENAPSFPRG